MLHRRAPHVRLKNLCAHMLGVTRALGIWVLYIVSLLIVTRKKTRPRSSVRNQSHATKLKNLVHMIGAMQILLTWEQSIARRVIVQKIKVRFNVIHRHHVPMMNLSALMVGAIWTRPTGQHSSAAKLIATSKRTSQRANAILLSKT